MLALLLQATATPVRRELGSVALLYDSWARKGKLSENTGLGLQR